MATTVFFLSTFATTHRGTNTAKLNGTNSGWKPLALSTSRGAGVVDRQAATVAGPTSGIEVLETGTVAEFLSDPVDADVTISGTITANIWARESDMSANTAINVIIDIVRANSFGADGSNEIVNIVKSTRTTELAISAGTNSVNNFTTGMTSGAYTPQTVNKGDRIRIRIFGDDSTTMGAGFTFTAGIAGTTGAANGDSFVTFNETFGFQTLSTPGGSTVYLRDTASDVSTAAVDREAWTTQGSTSSVTDVTNTQAGWVSPIQDTDTAGGTVVDWFTKQLQAVTLSGVAKGNLRLLESNALAAASARLEIARVDSDGTNPTVWGSWCLAQAGASGIYDLTTSNAAYTFWVTGDDLAISDGQRLRIRVYIDDSAVNPLGTGHTVTLGYDDGTGTNGDSFVTFAQTLTEFVAGGVVDQEIVALQAVNTAGLW